MQKMVWENWDEICDELHFSVLGYKGQQFIAQHLEVWKQLIENVGTRYILWNYVIFWEVTQKSSSIYMKRQPLVHGPGTGSGMIQAAPLGSGQTVSDWVLSLELAGSDGPEVSLCCGPPCRFSFSIVPVVKPQALYMLGKCSTIELHPSSTPSDTSY